MSEKDIAKLKDQLNKLDQKLNERIDKSNQNLKEQDNKIDENIENLVKMLDEKLDEQFNSLNEKIDRQLNDINTRFSRVEESIETIEKEISLNREQIQSQIKTQEDIIMDMIQKFNEKMLKDKTQIDSDLEDFKNNVDVFKISLDTLEKRILENAEAMITGKIKVALKNKEKEILMNMWISELKGVVKDLDKLKELHPKEFKLQIEEITSTIRSYKQKFVK